MDSVTALYGGLTALLFAGLSIHVSILRIRLKTSLGDNSDARVLRAVRAQGNCAEYIAILFLMLLLAEMTGGNSAVLHVMGGTILATRTFHAIGILGNKHLARAMASGFNYVVLVGLPGYVLFLRFT